MSLCSDIVVLHSVPERQTCGACGSVVPAYSIQQVMHAVRGVQIRVPRYPNSRQPASSTSLQPPARRLYSPASLKPPASLCSSLARLFTARRLLFQPVVPSLPVVYSAWRLSDRRLFSPARGLSSSRPSSQPGVASARCLFFSACCLFSVSSLQPIVSSVRRLFSPTRHDDRGT